MTIGNESLLKYRILLEKRKRYFKMKNNKLVVKAEKEMHFISIGNRGSQIVDIKPGLSQI